MAEITTKAQLCAEILRHENEFIRATWLIDALDISKNLAYYHLKSLVHDGILEKVGTRYALVNREKLIEVMLSSQEGQATLQRGEITPILPKQYIDSIQEIVDDCIWARAMDLPDSLATKVFVGELIDNAIKQLKKERRYLSEKQTSRGVVRKLIRKQGEEKWFEISTKTLETLGFEFTTTQKNRLNDLIDKMQEED